MKLLKQEPTTDVVAHDVAPLTVSTDGRPFSRLGWAIVLGGLVTFLVWASVAPLDKGVPVSGTLSTEGNRKAVQHQSGGTVANILVKDGDAVKAGQVLVQMSGEVAKANYDATRSQLFSTLAAEARLKAERDGARDFQVPARMQKELADPKAMLALGVQHELIGSRAAALQADLAAGEESAAGLRAQIHGLQEGAAPKQAQMKILKEQLEGLRNLSKDGYVARNRMLDLERTYLQMESDLIDSRANMARLERQVAEIAFRRVQRQQEFQRDVRGQLADVQREADIAIGRADAAAFEMANVEVKSPADGVVMGMNVFTKGGVVPPGFRMMDVVPSGDTLTVEGEIPVNLVDKVHAGLKVELIFSAFNTNTTPHIPGEVEQVSADRYTNERTGMPYYRLKARVTKAGMAQIVKHKMSLRPGMPVELFVHTGERTLMNYLLKPVFDRAKTSLSEE